MIGNELAAVLAYTPASFRSAPAHFRREGLEGSGLDRKHTPASPWVARLVRGLADLSALFDEPKLLNHRRAISSDKLPTICTKFAHTNRSGAIWDLAKAGHALPNQRKGAMRLAKEASIELTRTMNIPESSKSV